MANHVFVVSIGPVQDFIASARRCRDLWFGSWLLSELAKTAAKTIVQRQANTQDCLIFPAPKKESNDLEPGSHFNAPNKILAMIAGEPDEIAVEVKKAIDERLRQIRDKAYQKVGRKEYFFTSTANRQVEDLVEYYWASAEIMPGRQYYAARKLAEHLLAARKATRNFNPVDWGRGVPKSSLDGQRESVIDEKAYKEVFKENPEQLRKSFGVGPGEHLCGVGMLKRHGIRGDKDRVFSTSHVAALPLIQSFRHLEPATTKAAFQEYLSTLKETCGMDVDEHNCVPMDDPIIGAYDGRLFFEDRFRDYLDESKIERAREGLKAFLKQAAPGKTPLPYYAILLADGDRMGKAIDRLETEDQHRDISRALDSFADEVRRIIDEHTGTLVYAGGDDVLAFVPLHTVIECAEKLADDFKTRLEKFQDREGKSPTLSVGIAIGHHLEPLSEILELARKAEKVAKKAGRNALAITVSKRSGSNTTVVGQWGTLNNRLKLFIALHRMNAIPDGAAYELRQLALDLNEAHHLALPEKSVFLEAIRAEASRILKRKKAEGGTKKLTDEIRQKIETLMKVESVSVEAIAEELIVAKEFARAQDLATPAGQSNEKLQSVIDQFTN